MARLSDAADGIERFAERRPRLFSCLLLAFALGLRLSLLLVAAAVIGTRARNLSLFYDGLSFVYISQTFPWVYAAAPKALPIFYKPVYFTAMLPLYPFLIYAADFVLRDPRVGALVVSQLAAGAAVVVFYRLARLCTPRPAFAAALFCAFPPTWLLAGSLAFVEPLQLCLFIAIFYFFRTGRFRASAACAAAAFVTQKSAVLMPLILLPADAWRRGPRRPPWLAPFALSLIPVLFLQAYLGRLFGDPWINVTVLREVNGGPSFVWPFQAFLAGLLSPEQIFHGHFWLRKAFLGLSCGFYLAVFVMAWRRRSELDGGLIAWLGVVLLFNSTLGGIRSYIPFPRYMTSAAPAAILLAVNLIAAQATRRPAVWTALWAALAAWLPAVVAINVLDVISVAELLLRLWPRGYFQLLMRYFAGG